MKNWSNKNTVLEEARQYATRKAFFKGSQSCYNAAKRNGWFEEACTHMPKNDSALGKFSKWSKLAVFEEAANHNTKIDFRKNSPVAYSAALKRGWMAEISLKMKALKRKYTNQELIDIFKDCKTKKEALNKDRNAYSAVKHRKLQGVVFAHMPSRAHKIGEESPHARWSDAGLAAMALPFLTRIDFLEKEPQAYQAAYKREILDQICSHMEGQRVSPTNEELAAEALKHETRLGFQTNSNPNYQMAQHRGILEDICKHMKRSVSVSSQERFLFNIIKDLYPETRKLSDRKVKIEGKSHIKGFDIDIYVPGLSRGIEFDGKYWHSFKKMRENKKNWPDEDVRNYHEIKDDWFASKGIRVLHIKEEDWKKDKEKCIVACIEFLGAKDGL